MTALTEETKTYIQHHQLETTITDAVNQVLQVQQSDPNALFFTIFSHMAQNHVHLVDFRAIQILNSDGLPQIKVLEYKYLEVLFVVNHHDQLLNIDSCINSNTPSQEQGTIYLYDQEPQQFSGKGMKKIIEVFNHLKPLVVGGDIRDQSDVDKILHTYLLEHPNQQNAITTLSFSLPYVVSKSQNMEYFHYLREQFNHSIIPNVKFPKLFINLLQGSKLVGLKSKIYRLMLIVNEQENLDLATTIINTVIANLRKTIVSGKLGEAALKFYFDGTFLSIADSIPDNLKIVEDAINQSPYKDKCAIGIVWQADLYYNPDKKNYELDNPKQLLDADQLIEYYFKLTEDRPLIQYMEDPLFTGDMKGWQKLLNRFKNSKVKIGTRKISFEEATTNEVIHYLSYMLSIPYFFLRPYEMSTFSAFKEMILKNNNTTFIVGGQLSDTLDTSLVDIAFGLPNAILNLNLSGKYEQLIKFNRIQEIVRADNEKIN